MEATTPPPPALKVTVEGATPERAAGNLTDSRSYTPPLPDQEAFERSSSIQKRCRRGISRSCSESMMMSLPGPRPPPTPSHHRPFQSTPRKSLDFGSLRLGQSDSSIHDDSSHPAMHGGYAGAHTTLTEHEPEYLEREFEVLGEVGRGDFGVVLKVRSRSDGMLYAIKKSRRSFRGHKDKAFALKEVEHLRLMAGHGKEDKADADANADADAAADADDDSVYSGYTVRFHDAWEQNGDMYIQTELFERGTLRHLLDCSREPVPEHTIWGFLADIARGLHHIHAHRLVHLDIKPDNVFVSDRGTVKIGDFGLSWELDAPADDAGGHGAHGSHATVGGSMIMNDLLPAFPELVSPPRTGRGHGHGHAAPSRARLSLAKLRRRSCGDVALGMTAASVATQATATAAATNQHQPPVAAPPCVVSQTPGRPTRHNSSKTPIFVSPVHTPRRHKANTASSTHVSTLVPMPTPQWTPPRSEMRLSGHKRRLSPGQEQEQEQHQQQQQQQQQQGEPWSSAVSPVPCERSLDMSTLETARKERERRDSLQQQLVMSQPVPRTPILEGDPTYLAPELLDHSLGPVGPAADVFSLGILLFELAADVNLPSRGEEWQRLRHDDIRLCEWSTRFAAPTGDDGDCTNSNIKATIANEEHEDASCPSRISSSLRALIRAMLSRNPSLRPTVEQLLAHPCVSPVVQGQRTPEQLRRHLSLPPVVKVTPYVHSTSSSSGRWPGSLFTAEQYASGGWRGRRTGAFGARGSPMSPTGLVSTLNFDVDDDDDENDGNNDSNAGGFDQPSFDLSGDEDDDDDHHHDSKLTRRQAASRLPSRRRTTPSKGIAKHIELSPGDNGNGGISGDGASRFPQPADDDSMMPCPLNMSEASTATVDMLQCDQDDTASSLALHDLSSSLWQSQHEMSQSAGDDDDSMEEPVVPLGLAGSVRKMSGKRAHVTPKPNKERKESSGEWVWPTTHSSSSSGSSSNVTTPKQKQRPRLRQIRSTRLQ